MDITDISILLSVISSYIQLYPVISSYIQLYPVISSYIQLYPVISSYIQLYPVISSYISYIQLYPVISVISSYIQLYQLISTGSLQPFLGDISDISGSLAVGRCWPRRRSLRAARGALWCPPGRGGHFRGRISLHSAPRQGKHQGSTKSWLI